MVLLLKLFILAVLSLGINGQTATIYNIYWPSSNDTVLQIQMSFDNVEAKFVVNMQIQGDHWAGLGFAKSGDVEGEMYGVDAWIYGDFGGTSNEVIEYALGDHEIGTADAQQNLEYSLYSQGDTVQVHIERALDTGTRDDYVVVEGGDLCILWALGTSTQVESGHNATTRGEQCFELTGTTQAPTPSPSYVPSPSPSQDPTTKPTNHPTTVGGTAPPSPSPTPKPTDDPTTASPTIAPTRLPTRVPGSPSPAPTPAPTGPPTKDPDAPTEYPSLAPSEMPTAAFDDNENTDAGAGADVETDAFEAWTWIIVGILACLVLCLLAAIVFCYVRNRRQRQKRNKEKEDAYEQLENYRAKHGLDIPDNTPNKRKDDDDDLEAGAGNVAQSGVVLASSDDEEDDLVSLENVAAPPGYAPPTANGRKESHGRGPRKPARQRSYRDKDLGIDGMDDDDDNTIMADMETTPGGPALPESTTKQAAKQSLDDSEAHHSKFVDPNKEKRDRIRKERNKRVADRAKLSHTQASESAEKKKRLVNKQNDNTVKSDSEDGDDYDYDAAKKEREERRKRRESRRNRSKKKGKFGVFDEDNW